MSSLYSDGFGAGRVYKFTGAIPMNLLRSPIYQAWERSHLQGANPCALQAEKLSSLDAERFVEQDSHLINAVQCQGKFICRIVWTNSNYSPNNLRIIKCVEICNKYLCLLVGLPNPIAKTQLTAR
jgi:hypothetical protein